MLNIINDNILNMKEGIIIHQVNNRGVMGAGLAKQIRSLYPQHYNEYKMNKLQMGTLIITPINDKLLIIGIVAQDGYGRDKRYTDYKAFNECIDKLYILSTQCTLPMFIPYGIGCGLAGGRWNLIYEILSNKLPNATLVKLDNK